MTEYQITHAPDCWGWGPRHYECALREIELLVAEWKRVTAENARLREDAERYRYLSSVATQQADALGPIFRIDVRRTPQTLFNFDAAVDHARRIEGEL